MTQKWLRLPVWLSVLKRVAVLCAIACIFLTGCTPYISPIDELAVTPDGRILLVRDHFLTTDIQACTEVKGTPPQLNCRSYKVTNTPVKQNTSRNRNRKKP